MSYTGGGCSLGKNTYPTSTLSRVRTDRQTDERSENYRAPDISDAGALINYCNTITIVLCNSTTSARVILEIVIVLQ